MSTLEESQERRNVARAKWTILYDGNLLPVTNLYDSDAEEIDDPMHACACVAYDPDSTDTEGHWLTIGSLDPGEVLWSRHHVPNGPRWCQARPAIA